MYKCYFCEQKNGEHYFSEYELKDGSGKVDVCIECENDGLTYFDKIKRLCLIDGQDMPVTKKDEQYIEAEKKLKAESDEEERIRWLPKSIYYITNEPKKSIDLDYQAVKFVNSFLGKTDHETDHIQRLKFTYDIRKHWIVDKFDIFDRVEIWLDGVNKEYQQVKKPGEKEWRERIRRWYFGRIITGIDLYDVTFGFSQYDDEPCGDVWINYEFVCSRERKLKQLVREQLSSNFRFS